MTKYKDRDPDALEPHYCEHVLAMTDEGLHSKARIAAELAVRDKRIQELKEALRFYAGRHHILSQEAVGQTINDGQDVPINWRLVPGLNGSMAVEIGGIGLGVLMGVKLDWSDSPAGAPPQPIEGEN